jgi:ribulose-phosphate 3-epimerase
MLPKIARLRQMIDERGLTCTIEVDGGMAPSNAFKVVKAGASVLVAGAAVFGAAEGVVEAVRRLRAGGEAN